MKYSNPRMHAVVENWPHGALRTTATFNVETHPRTGMQRATRTTVDPKRGGTSKPKLGVYAPRVRIVDGDDGRTYIASLTMYRSISVTQGNMQYQAEHIDVGSPRYAEALALFEEVQS